MKESRLIVVLLSVLVLFAIGFVLSELQSVLLPFAIAVFFSYIFKPIVLFAKKRRIPLVISLLVVLLVLAAILFGLSMIIASSVESFIDALPRYQAKLNSLLTGTLEYVETTATSLGVKVEDFRITDAFQLGSITSFVTSSVGSFFNFLSTVALILLFMIFILAGSGQLVEKIDNALAVNHSHRIASIIENIDGKVRRYLVVKTLVSLTTGALTAIILGILGVDFALLWGFLAFLLNFIPTVGSIFAIIFPVLISLMQFDSLTQPLLVLVLLGVMQNVLGNIVEPRLMAFSLNLSPLLILVSLIFWGWLWGVWGMILAVPIMSMVKILCENVEILQPIAALMSGRISKRE